jgi:Ca2+-binding RTX toxin-like protein
MVTFNRTDLEFILTQIKMAEAGQPPVNVHLAFGLREVAGTNNNLVPGQEDFGSSDLTFPRVTEPVFRTVTINIDGTVFDPNPGVDGDTMTTTYASADASAIVVDTAPRTISNLISDQSADNPAAVDAAAAANDALGTGYQNLVPNPAFDPTLPVDPVTNPEFLPGNQATPPVVDASGNLFINNVTPDAGLSAPFNTWMTLFGQFFDHGLDLIGKGGSGAVFIPLLPDDPLYVEGSPNNFMVLTRATNLPGADGILGTADDIHEGTNSITPFVDQSQTYASHPSHQVFLREYMIGSDGKLHSSGKLLSHITAGQDGVLGTADDARGLATWADLKANALKLGIKLTDADVNDIPLLAADAYGNVILGANGFAQVVVRTGNGADGIAGTNDDSTVLVEGNAQGLDLNDTAALGGTVVRIGAAFINDKNHNADPFDAQTGAMLAADADSDAGNQPAPGTYDNELLDAHYVAGDGRINENLGLTAVHEIFHSEHDRLTEQTKDLVRAELANGDTSFALEWVLPGADLSDGIQDNEWNGERLFQAAKFGTETQYQHLVFEEFARKIAPTIHVFGNIDISLDPAITAEFANVVYRFGHSMLDETLNIDTDPNAEGVQQMSLIDAFTNPLGYLAQGPDAAGSIVMGSTSQVANEIDEFVTGALRNNLLGLPLDLAALNIARGRDTGVAPLNLVRNQIFAATGDTNLKPYENWAEFGQFLKHAASLINFVAAYGTHASIIGATTLEEKRAAALQLVADGLNEANVGTDAYNFMHSLGAYANSIDNPLAVHATWSTGSITGLDNVDLWIGGLAEKQTLFGGLLGSTFQFIFETQLEALQDGDRLYYLPRLEGIHFGSEIEANSFAQLILANTNAKHLPGDVFLTPEYVVEASTITDDPATWLRNPETGALLVEKLPDGTIHFIGDDNFLGNTIVLGGTEGDDRLVSGHADDDTVWGDGGNDYIDGGNGNDFLFGGDGNDLISDEDGDDTIHGDAGNDTIFAGRGDDTIFGGDGNDFIDTGLSGPLGIDTAVGGLGNDIIFGGDGDDELQGNEGDDWIEGGDGGDLIIGDQGAPTGQVPLIQGNDVLIGGVQGDRMQGFSGDDIMTGQGGFDKFEGRLGFDWASFELEDHGVSIDMNRREFIDMPQVPGGDAIRDFFVETEAASGTAFADFLRGTDVGTGNPFGTVGFDTFNELSNVNLITGLADYFPVGPVAFSDGNILFGGGGSDFIEGRGGNDIIDGDARLHVELTSHSAGGQIIREILYNQAVGPTIDPETGAVLTAGDIDTAVFSDVSANYQISFATDPLTGEILFGTDGNPVLQVVHTPPVGGGGVGGGGVLINDGTDTLYNIERLQFSDVTIENPFAQFVSDFVAQGAIVLDNAAPAVGDTLTIASSTVNDFEGVLVNGVLDAATAGFERIDIPLNELSLQWQYLDPVAVGGNPPQWVNIAGATSASFVVGDFFVGVPLRVLASFTDGLGVHEAVASAQTAIVVTNPAVNHAPTIVTQVAQPGLPDTTGREDTPLGTTTRPGIFLPLITTFTDDNTAANRLIYTATLANGDPLETVGLSFEIVPDAAGLVAGGRITGTPTANFAGPIDIRVKATDAGGLSVTDTFTINVLPVNDGAASLSIEGTPDEGATLTAVLGPDPDGPGTTPALQWLRDGVAIPAARAAAYTLTAADVGHVISVRATYTDGQGFAETVTSAPTGSIAGLNIAPVITSNGGGDTAAVPVVENATAVTTVTATDANAGTTLTYSIAGGADAGLFTINASTGALSFITSPDFETPADADSNNVYDVIVQASDGSLVDTQAISVTVTNAAPQITSNGAGAAATVSVAENGAAVTTVAAEDAGAQVIYSIAGGADAALFTIDPGTGAVSFISAPDFDAPADADGDNVYDVIVSASDGSLADTQAIAVTVTNVAGIALTGTNVANILAGTGEEDSLIGLGGADTLDGLGGNDTLNGGTGSDVINGGDGNDTIVYAIGDGADTIDGGAGLDLVAISGGAGNDTLRVVFDGAAITGFENGSVTNVESITPDLGGGTDTLNYGGSTAGVTVDLAAGTASGFASIAGIENVTGGGGDDTLTGDAVANVMNGGAGNDTFIATIGDGNDSYNGAGGVDTYDLSRTFAGAIVTSTVAISAEIGTDVLANIENIIGSQGSDNITLGAGANFADGQDGNDTISTGAGNDTLLGGAGDDTLIGGTGADLIFGGAGNDTIVYTIGDGTDTIDGGDGLDTLRLLGAGANDTLNVLVDGTAITTVEGSTVASVEAVTVDLADGIDTLSYGATTADIAVDMEAGSASGFVFLAGVENVISGSGNDTLAGDAGANTLNGGDGNDVLNGGAGNDTLTGGAGNDTFIASIGDGEDIYNGGAGNDTYDLSGTTAGATVTATSATSAQIGTDTLSLIENFIGSQGNDIITGSAAANVIDGQAGDDIIDAGGGADIIIGGLGNDIMNGGAGNDAFVFAPGFGNDTIIGFDANPTNGQDLLDISGLDITAETFTANVLIEVLGSDTLVTIGIDSILLQGVNGVGANLITQQDFILA